MRPGRGGLLHRSLRLLRMRRMTAPLRGAEEGGGGRGRRSAVWRGVSLLLFRTALASLLRVRVWLDGIRHWAALRCRSLEGIPK